MEILKQSVGIDVSKDMLEVKFKEQTLEKTKIKGSRKFPNTPFGFSQLLEWSNKRKKIDNNVFVLEATGVYHEDLLYFLYSEGEKVSLQLPQRIKYFAKSKGIDTKNDKVDSGTIADFGLERSVKTWQPPSKKFKVLRDLSREHSILKELKVAAQNRLHAYNHSNSKDVNVIDRLESQIDFHEEQIKKTERDMKSRLKEDKGLSAKIKKIETIKGVGFITIIKIIAETGGFYLFNNINQLVSYAGLDVIENQSGKHKGKTRISKKGNANLRTALYMPSLTAIKHNKKLKTFHERLMKTHQYTKQGMVAVMRKLLILVYTLWRKDEEYNINFEWGCSG